MYLLLIFLSFATLVFFQEVIAEEERKQAIARQKIECVTKVPREPDLNHPDAIHIVIKLPGGERLDRRFLKTHSLEVNTDTTKTNSFDRSLAGNLLLCILPPEFSRFV